MARITHGLDWAGLDGWDGWAAWVGWMDGWMGRTDKAVDTASLVVGVAVDTASLGCRLGGKDKRAKWRLNPVLG